MRFSCRFFNFFSFLLLLFQFLGFFFGNHWFSAAKKTSKGEDLLITEKSSFLQDQILPPLSMFMNDDDVQPLLCSLLENLNYAEVDLPFSPSSKADVPVEAQYLQYWEKKLGGSRVGEEGTPAKIGVLLVSLGSPDSATYFGLMKYLREFLGDKRVIRLSRYIWNPILYGYILPFRSASSAKKYQRIMGKGEISPLIKTAYSQGKLLQEKLNNDVSEETSSKLDRFKVVTAMRYGEPSISRGLAELLSLGYNKILVLPLYPQPCSATTTSVYDGVSNYLLRIVFVPHIRLVNGYAEDSMYIQQLAKSVENFRRRKGRGEKLIVSFHGVPAAWSTDDPYLWYCNKTGKLLAEALNLSESEYAIAFQSRFGSAKWLEPYLDELLVQLVEEGVRVVDVISPGFAQDCLETIDEIGFEYKELFQEALGEREGELRYICALNDSADSIELLHHLVQDNIKGW